MIAPALSGWQLPRRFKVSSEGAKGLLMPVPVHAQRGLILVLADEAQGALVESLGYVNFYLLTTLAAVPGILLFWMLVRGGLIESSMGSAGKQSGH